MSKLKHLLAVVAMTTTGVIVADHMAHHTIDERTKPVSKVKVEKSVPKTSAVAGQPRAAKAIVDTYCIACHGTGMANAPKVADAATWGPRMELGMDAVLASAKKGKGVMPPMGTCADCSDDELIAAIEYLVNGQ